MSSPVTDIIVRNKFLTAKLLQKDYRYPKLRKAFSKFYRRHYEFVSKFKTGLRLFYNRVFGTRFYGDLVYNFKNIVSKADFSDQFRKLPYVINLKDQRLIITNRIYFLLSKFALCHIKP